MEISVKTTNFLIASFSLVIIVVFAFFWLVKPPKTYIFPQKKPTWEAKRLSRQLTETSGPKPVYDYDNMLKLLSNFRKIELEFYSNFEKFTSNSENIQKIQNTLNNLRTEKELYNQFFQKTNSFYKRTVPDKKRNNLRYQLRALDRSIHDLEAFLTKIKLNNHQIKKI
jgi:hypothetical protein